MTGLELAHSPILVLFHTMVEHLADCDPLALEPYCRNWDLRTMQVGSILNAKLGRSRSLIPKMKHAGAVDAVGVLLELADLLALRPKPNRILERDLE